jgi:hypothetical protein
MTDQQILTLCISLAVPFAMLIYSNSRVSDAKETLRAEMALGFERVNNKIDHLAEGVASLKEEVASLRALVETHLRDHHGFK